jgi:hypothetical protein
MISLVKPASLMATRSKFMESASGSGVSMPGERPALPRDSLQYRCGAQAANDLAPVSERTESQPHVRMTPTRTPKASSHAAKDSRPALVTPPDRIDGTWPSMNSHGRWMRSCSATASKDAGCAVRSSTRNGLPTCRN